MTILVVLATVLLVHCGSRFIVKDILGIPMGYTVIDTSLQFPKGTQIAINSNYFGVSGSRGEFRIYSLSDMSHIGGKVMDENISHIVSLLDPDGFLLVTQEGSLELIHVNRDESAIASDSRVVYAELERQGFAEVGVFEVSSGERAAVYRVWASSTQSFCQRVAGELHVAQFALSDDGSHVLFRARPASPQENPITSIFAKMGHPDGDFELVAEFEATMLEFAPGSNDLIATFGFFSGELLRSYAPNFDRWNNIVDCRDGVLFVDFSDDGKHAFVTRLSSYVMEWCLDTNATSRPHGIFDRNFRKEIVTQTAVDWDRRIVLHTTSEGRILLGKLRFDCPAQD